MNEQEAQSMKISPVGEVRNQIMAPILITDDSDIELQEQKEKMRQHQEEISNSISEVLIYPQWTELLDGIEGFSHILILYWPHLIGSEGRNLKKVHPMGRKDLPVKGIFSTCSPARPNPVLVSAVSLLERKGDVLKVKGLEAVDQSPIIDIKPYVKSYYQGRDKHNDFHSVLGLHAPGGPGQGIGSQSELASVLGVNRSAISRAKSRAQVPEGRHSGGQPR